MVSSSVGSLETSPSSSGITLAFLVAGGEKKGVEQESG